MNWAVAIIEPNRDFEASRALHRAGYRVVFLTYRKLLTGHNRPGWRTSCDFIDRPLFPGYLFVELWPDQPWPQPQRAGFQGFVAGASRKPLMLEDELVQKWKCRTNDGEFDDKRPDQRVDKAQRFMPANSPEERRALLIARFAQMVGEWAA